MVSELNHMTAALSYVSLEDKLAQDYQLLGRNSGYRVEGGEHAIRRQQLSASGLPLAPGAASAAQFLSFTQGATTEPERTHEPASVNCLRGTAYI